jgi:AcrR family transcriptional regulator
MTEARTPEAERLLGLVADHLLAHGIAGISLSRLAKDIGSNNRMLLYYFGSKEALLAAGVAAAYRRFPELRDLTDLLGSDGELDALLRTAWRRVRAPENRPYLTLFFESFASAVRDPDANRDALDDLATEWPTALAGAFRTHGYADAKASLAATQVLALWRGLQFALLEGVPAASLDEAHDAAIAALLHP